MSLPRLHYHNNRGPVRINRLIWSFWIFFDLLFGNQRTKRLSRGTRQNISNFSAWHTLLGINIVYGRVTGCVKLGNSRTIIMYSYQNNILNPERLGREALTNFLCPVPRSVVRRSFNDRINGETRKRRVPNCYLRLKLVIRLGRVQ